MPVTGGSGVFRQGRMVGVAFKIVVVTVAALAVVAGAAGWISTVSFSSFFSGVLEEKAAAGVKAVEYVVERRINRAEAEAGAFAAADFVLNAIKSSPGEHPSLPLEIERKTGDSGGFDFFAVVDSDGKLIAGAGDGSQAGGKRGGITGGVLSGKMLSGFEDIDGKWSASGGAPVRDGNGTVIGAVIVGFDLSSPSIADEAKEISGVETTLFRGDERITTTIMTDGGKRAVGTKLAPAVADIVLGEGKPYIGQADILGHPHVTAYVPIKSPDGKNIGIYFAGSSLEKALIQRNGIIRNVVSASVLLAVVFSGVIFILIRRIISPLKKLLPVIERVGQGDFSLSEEAIDTASSDEIGLLAKSFRMMYVSIRKELQGASEAGRLTATKAYSLAETARKMSQSADNIANAAEELSALAQDNAAALEEASASIEEIAGGASAGAENAASGAESAAATTQKADEAGTLVKKTMDSLSSIRDESSKARDVMKNVEKSVQSITGFVSTISSIADQTNLLALNAAIEAARAGDAGRGFAVVADEVRKLAEESNRAADEVKKQISELSVHAGESVASMTRVDGVVSAAVDEAKNTWDRLEETLAEIDKISDVLQTVAAAAQEQAAASQEAAQGIDSAVKNIAEEAETIGNLRKTADETRNDSSVVLKESEAVKATAVHLVKELKKFRFDAS